MLAELETAIVQRLEALKKPVPWLELRNYGGELSDPDLLVNVLRAGHAVLVTTPKGRFVRKSNRRLQFQGTVRLIIASRQSRGESETRHGSSAGSPGTYALWDSCMRLLVDWCPADDAGVMVPTDYNNLINGRFQNDYLSVLGQSFAVDLPWSVPADAEAPLDGIDLSYFLQPDDQVADATDRITIEEAP